MKINETKKKNRFLSFSHIFTCVFLHKMLKNVQNTLNMCIYSILRIFSQKTQVKIEQEMQNRKKLFF